MKTQSLRLWWLRTATFLLAALAAASAAYWVLKWSSSAPANRAPAAVRTFSRTTQTDPQVVARLLGGGQKAVAGLVESASSRFKLIGVIANRTHGGYALISVDGKPARPYEVGAALNESLVLKSVAARSAALAASTDSPISLTLELPVLTSNPSTAPTAPLPVTGAATAAVAPAPEATAPPAPATPRQPRSRATRSNTE
ncbi:MAG: type II secretion system protein N [Comamonadaceae bacterium]